MSDSNACRRVLSRGRGPALYLATALLLLIAGTAIFAIRGRSAADALLEGIRANAHSAAVSFVPTRGEWQTRRIIGDDAEEFLTAVKYCTSRDDGIRSSRSGAMRVDVIDRSGKVVGILLLEPGGGNDEQRVFKVLAGLTRRGEILSDSEVKEIRRDNPDCRDCVVRNY